MKRILELEEVCLGESSHIGANTCSQLSSALLTAGRFEQGLTYAKKSYAAYAAAWGFNHHAMETYRQSLINVLRLMKREEEVAEYLKPAIPPDCDPHNLALHMSSFRHKGDECVRTGNLGLAKSYYEDAVKITAYKCPTSNDHLEALSCLIYFRKHFDDKEGCTELQIRILEIVVKARSLAVPWESSGISVLKDFDLANLTDMTNIKNLISQWLTRFYLVPYIPPQSFVVSLGRVLNMAMSLGLHDEALALIPRISQYSIDTIAGIRRDDLEHFIEVLEKLKSVAPDEYAELLETKLRQLSQ